MTKRNGNISPLTFIDKVIKKNELGQPFGLFSLREILSLALVRWSGQVTPRKINAAVALSFAILAAVRNRRPFDTEEAVKELLGAGDRREIYRLGEVVARTPLYIAHFVTTLTWFQLYGNFAGKLANVITKVQVPIPYAIRSKVRLDHPESIYAPGGITVADLRLKVRVAPGKKRDGKEVKHMELLKRLCVEEDGQGLVEYTLIVVLVALVFWVAIKNTDVGNQLSSGWSKVTSCVGDPSACDTSS